MFYCSNTLSKSLPASLPSQLSYSSNYASEHHQTKSFESSNQETQYSDSSEESLDERPYYTHETLEPQLSSFQQRNITSSSQIDKQIKIPSKLLLISIIVIILAYLLTWNTSTQADNKNIYDKIKFNKDLYIIGEDFHISNDIILKIQIG